MQYLHNTNNLLYMDQEEQLIEHYSKILEIDTSASFYKVFCRGKNKRINNIIAHVSEPIITHLRPLPAVVFPIWSISTVIIESFVKAVVEITGGVAAVVLVVSLASIVMGVESIDTPPCSISTVSKLAPVAAVVKEALTSLTVNANGMRN